MTNTANCLDAASQLLRHRVADAKFCRLDPQIRPNSIDEALAIQAEMIRQSGDTIGGWKALLPPDAKQRIVAPIFAQTINRGAFCRLFADNQRARIEPEIAFVLAKDLPAKQSGYTPIEIDQALCGCYMALELLQDRFQENSGADFYEKLADCLVNQGLYIGPQIETVLAYQASEISINVSQSGNTQHFSGKHPNQLPQNPLYWLINFMSKRGIDFKAGQVIITGSYAGVIEVQFNRKTEIEYVGLGKYSIEFSARL